MNSETNEKMQSDTLGKLFEALSKAQGAIESAIKDKKNPFYKSSYADLASVWDACRQPLSDNGLCVVQATCGAKSDSYLVTTLGHSSGEWIKSFLPLMLVKQDPQGMGSALTYARRYALSAIVGICQEDDDGNRAVKALEKERAKKERNTIDTDLCQVGSDTTLCQFEPKMEVITDALESELKALLIDNPELREKVNEFLGSKNFTELTQLDYGDFMKILNRARKIKGGPDEAANA